jgi:PTS system nitrogen regulatory IIA component
MPYRTMSLEEFAKHVSLDAREVRRLADRGKLPGHKVQGQWRFNRARVTEWLQQEMHKLDEGRLVALEGSMSGETAMVPGDTRLVVTDLIGMDGIDVALGAKTRPSVLRELVRLAERTGLLYDSQGLLEALQEREQLCSTALPNGVAIPHPRQPMPYVSAEPLLCVARIGQGISFGDPKGSLTRLFFLICCHEDRNHLHILARLMRILDDVTIDRLLYVDSSEDLLATLITREEAVVAAKR